MTRQPEVPAGVFEPRPSRQETKADTTTAAARTILDAEARARDNKTAKLRALRLAQEAAAPPAPARPARTSRKPRV